MNDLTWGVWPGMALYLILQKHRAETNQLDGIRDQNNEKTQKVRVCVKEYPARNTKWEFINLNTFQSIVTVRTNLIPCQY